MAGMGTIHGHKLRTFYQEGCKPKTGFPFDPIVFELVDQVSMADLVEGLSKVQHHNVDLAMII